MDLLWVSYNKCGTLSLIPHTFQTNLWMIEWLEGFYVTLVSSRHFFTAFATCLSKIVVLDATKKIKKLHLENR